MPLYGRQLNGRAVMKTILYCRVSTSDQNLDHQVTQARGAGFVIDEVVSDNGVSGVSTRLAERDQGKRLFDLLRRGDVLVVRWIDRLGRNYADVTEVIRGLCHVNLNWPREVSTTQFEFMRLSQLATSGKLLLGRRGACGGM